VEQRTGAGWRRLAALLDERLRTAGPDDSRTVNGGPA